MSGKNAKLLLAALIAGQVRFEFFTGSKTDGEVCFNGLRYYTVLDKDGVPDIQNAALIRRLEALREPVT